MKRIVSESDMINDIPYSFFYEDFGEKRPLVLVLHSYMASKNNACDLAYSIAERGLCTLTFDAYNHGGRYTESREGLEWCSVEQVGEFFNVVEKTMQDVDFMLHNFMNHPRVDANRIGVTGVSLGAYLTYTCLLRNTEVVTAVPIIGTPCFTKELIYILNKADETDFRTESEIKLLKLVKGMDPSETLLKTERRPILILSTINDEICPYEHSYEFYNKLKENYTDQSMVSFVGFDGGHSPYKELMDMAIEWFVDVLGSFGKEA